MRKNNIDISNRIVLDEIKGHPLYVNALVNDVGLEKAFEILVY